jgi:hypothetical protein
MISTGHTLYCILAVLYFSKLHIAPEVTLLSCVSPVNLTDGEKVGEGGGEGVARSMEKAWPSIDHSILSG